ncbi:MAG: DUF3450 domain-containing protein [Proteobacteria bacterium]|nr:DUF3450 domain-containing protein [Pseudomonadota bacterium]MBU1714265.1 DUF3450 domain-containing protein [Pseudomonadota bacterium]
MFAKYQNFDRLKEVEDRIVRFCLFLFFGLLILLPSGPARAGTDDEMISSIMALRSSIETLYSRVDVNRENYKAEMKSLSLQIADAEAQINRKNTAIKLAEVELGKVKNIIAEASSKSMDLAPLLDEVFSLQITTIEGGIPFKIAERRAALDEIRSDLREKLITPERALALLWASFEDNVRLTREIGLFKQKIEINGTEMLADVAKIGTVMLFFSTPDKLVGHVVQDKHGYTYQVINHKQQQEEIAMLFDALNKQIRTGYFTLPNGLVLQGGRS